MLSNIGLGLGLTRRRAGFNPATLFAGAEQGAFYDPSDLASMWQDSAGTTPAANDQPIGKLDDKSGNGNHIVQATAGQRPTKRLASGLHYAEFVGASAQWLGANLANMRITGDLTICAGVIQTAGTTGAIAVCQTSSGAVTPYEFRYNEATTLLMRHADAASFEDTTLTVPTTAIVTSVRRLSGVNIEMSVNGARTTTAKPIVPTADASSAFRVGGRIVDTVADLTGRLYGLVIINRRLTDTELADLEAWMAAKAGVSL